MFRLEVRPLVEEDCEKMQMNGLVWQKDIGH